MKAFWHYWRHESAERKEYWKQNRDEFPPGPSGFWAEWMAVFAFMFPFVAKTYYPRLMKKYGDLVLVPTIFGQFIVLVGDAGLHESFSLHRTKEVKRGWLQGLFESVAGDLISTDGPSHDEVRTRINPYFSKAALDEQVEMIQKIISEGLDEVHALLKQGVHIQPHLTKVFERITSQVLTGGGPIPEGLGLLLIELIDTLQMNPIKHFFLRRKVKRIVNKMLEDAIGKDYGILSEFANDVTSKDPRTRVQQLDKARARVVGFMNAAIETTSNLTCWVLYHLAKNPSIYKQVRREVESVYGDSDVISHEQMRGLVYTMAAVSEGLRRGNAVWRELREVRPEFGNGIIVEFNGRRYVVPQFTQVFTLVNYIHTDPKVWGEYAEQFNPEIHLNGFVKQLPKGAFTPFALGRLTCPGKFLAPVIAAVTAAEFAKRFGHLECDQNLEPVFGAVLGFPHEGVLKAA